MNSFDPGIEFPDSLIIWFPDSLLCHSSRMEREFMFYPADIPTDQRTRPPLYQFLVGSCLGHTGSPLNLKCPLEFYLTTFCDLITWDRSFSRWSRRENNGPKALEKAIITLVYPPRKLPPPSWSSMALLSRWLSHLLRYGYENFRVTFSLSPSTTAWGYAFTVLYRRWHTFPP